MANIDYTPKVKAVRVKGGKPVEDDIAAVMDAEKKAPAKPKRAPAKPKKKPAPAKE